MNTETCPNCGTPLVHTPGRRAKKFCSNNCRSLYWQKMNAKVKKNNLPENKARILAERETPPETSNIQNPLTSLEAKYVTLDEVVKAHLAKKPETQPEIVPDQAIWQTDTKLEALPPSPLIKEEADQFPPQPEPGSYFDMPVSPPLQQGRGFDYYIEKIPELMYEQEFKDMAKEIDKDPGLTQKQKDLLKIKMRTANL